MRQAPKKLPEGVAQNRNGTFSVDTKKLTPEQQGAIKRRNGQVPPIVVVESDKIENILRR